MLAYLLLVHNSPRQVGRLVAALEGPDVEFFIHVDRKVDPGQFRYQLRRHRKVHFVRPRQIVEWGGWNMVDAELTLMRRAVKRGARSMVLLSGMDYPVWSNRRLNEFFLSTRKNYIEHFRIPSVYWDRGARNRVRQFWLCDDPIRIKSELWIRTVGRVWRGVWHRLIRRYGNLVFKLGYELGIHRRMPAELQPYVGSQWWCLTREACEYLLNYVNTQREVVKFYRHTHVPDESFIQTVLMNSPLSDTLVNNNLHYVEWDGGFNPRVLEVTDLEAINASGSAFARKVALGTAKDSAGKPVTSEPLIRALEARRTAEEEKGYIMPEIRAVPMRGELVARSPDHNGH